MKKTIMLLIIFSLILSSFTSANNESGSLYTWYDKFDSITSWDFNTPNCGDQSGSPELEIFSLGGVFGNVIRSNTAGASCMELDNSDISLQNTPISVNFMTYDNQGYWYVFNLRTAPSTGVNTIFGGGVAGADTFILDATDGSARTVSQDNDWTANKWYNNTYYLSNTFIEYWINGTLMINTTLDVPIDISTYDLGFLIRTDGNNQGYFDEYKIWYGRPEEEPMPTGIIDNNLTITLNYPTNNTIFYGDYTGIVSVNLSYVNGTASCDINNTNWIENGTTYGNETVYFYNNNVTGNNQSLIINCSDLDQTKSIDFWFYQENVINLTFFNEETLELMNGTNITIDFISSTGNTNGSTITGVYSSLYFPLGDMEINFKADGYAIRQNYFTLYPGQQYSIDLYLINESTSTQIFIELYDEFGKELEGYYVKTYRRIDGIYYNVETSKTNWDGKADFYGFLSTPMYYWIITNKAGEVLKMSGESEIYGTTLPFNVVLEEPAGRTFNKLGGLIYTLTFDNTTKKFIYNYHDTTYTSTASTLEVKTYPEGVIVGSNTSTAQAGILTVDISSIFVNGTTYMAQTYINFSPAVYVSSISHTFPLTPFNMGGFGLFLTIIIIIGVAFSGLWNPAVMFILEGLAVFLTKAVELHHLSYVTCVTILCLCLISAYLVSDRT